MIKNLKEEIALIPKNKSISKVIITLVLFLKWITNGNKEWVNNKHREKRDNFKNKSRICRNNFYVHLVNYLKMVKVKVRFQNNIHKKINKSKLHKKWKGNIWNKEGINKERKGLQKRTVRIKKLLPFLAFFSYLLFCGLFLKVAYFRNQFILFSEVQFTTHKLKLQFSNILILFSQNHMKNFQLIRKISWTNQLIKNTWPAWKNNVYNHRKNVS